MVRVADRIAQDKMSLPCLPEFEPQNIHPWMASNQLIAFSIASFHSLSLTLWKVAMQKMSSMRDLSSGSPSATGFRRDAAL